MTFQVSFDEWVESQKLLAERRNRLVRFRPYSLVLLLFAYLCFLSAGSWVVGGVGTAVMMWFLFDNFYLRLRRIKRRFVARYGDEMMPEVTLVCSSAGVTLESQKGNVALKWENFCGITEGKNVWVLWLVSKKRPLLTVPKRALQRQEAQRERAYAENYFTPRITAPIAHP